MIHVRAWSAQPDPNAPEDSTLQITITTKADLEKFKWILNRALNLAPPHDPTNTDWFALTDKLEDFISRIPA